jgi:hypothetical protein
MTTVRLGEHDWIYSESETEHRIHCSYVRVKQFRAFISHHPLDGYLLRYNHTSHCALKLTKPSNITGQGYSHVQFRI